jgi:hypothetical protein
MSGAKVRNKAYSNKKIAKVQMTSITEIDRQNVSKNH